MDDDLDKLTRRLTNRMVQVERQARWRWRLFVAAIGLLILLIVVAAVVFLLEGYGLNLRE